MLKDCIDAPAMLNASTGWAVTNVVARTAFSDLDENAKTSTNAQQPRIAIIRPRVLIGLVTLSVNAMTDIMATDKSASMMTNAGEEATAVVMHKPVLIIPGVTDANAIKDTNLLTTETVPMWTNVAKSMIVMNSPTVLII